MGQPAQAPPAARALPTPPSVRRGSCWHASPHSTGSTGAGAGAAWGPGPGQGRRSPISCCWPTAMSIIRPMPLMAANICTGEGMAAAAAHSSWGLYMQSWVTLTKRGTSPRLAGICLGAYAACGAGVSGARRPAAWCNAEEAAGGAAGLTPSTGPQPSCSPWIRRRCRPPAGRGAGLGQAACGRCRQAHPFRRAATASICGEARQAHLGALQVREVGLLEGMLLRLEGGQPLPPPVAPAGGGGAGSAWKAWPGHRVSQGGRARSGG